MSVEIIDNTDEIISMTENAIEGALWKCGATAEKYAKAACPVDTGLLRNSITFALDGKATNIRTYKDNDRKQSGSYSGQAPREPEGSRAVYVGTNVSYAQYVENGTGGDRKKGPRPFIRSAISDHLGEYMDIIREELESV